MMPYFKLDIRYTTFFYSKQPPNPLSVTLSFDSFGQILRICQHAPPDNAKIFEKTEYGPK